MNEHLTTTLFEGCSRRERSGITGLGTVADVAPGRRLATEGAVGKQFAVVLDGELVVTRDGHEVARLHTGDCMGEIALLGDGLPQATATVTATIASRVWVLSRSEFTQLCDKAPSVANRLHHVGLTRAAANATEHLG